MSKIVNQMIGPTNLAGPGFVPPKLAGKKRFPFAFVIDISGSTGAQPDPDIDHINGAIAALIDTLRNPTPSSELAKNVDSVDVCIIAYSASANVILPWSIVKNLPPSIQPLVPETSTGTGAALSLALAEVAARLRYYKDPANKFAFGMPHIIHLTDGAMTDMSPGDGLWNAISGQLANLATPTNTETCIATLIHFISPKGCMADRLSVGGRTFSGMQLLAELSGTDSVHEMTSQIATFEQLVKMVTVMITKITQNFGTSSAVSAGKESAGHSAPPSMAQVSDTQYMAI